jgi:hypothetical protein
LAWPIGAWCRDQFGDFTMGEGLMCGYLVSFLLGSGFTLFVTLLALNRRHRDQVERYQNLMIQEGANQAQIFDLKAEVTKAQRDCIRALDENLALRMAQRKLLIAV